MNTSKCAKNCGVELYWSDSVTSKTGKKIPLEVEYKPDDPKHEYPQFNGKHHNCPNSSYAQKNPNVTTNRIDNPPMEQKQEYKFKVLDAQAVNPINGKIDYLLDLRHLIEERVKGTQYDGNQAAIGQLLNLLTDELRFHAN